MRASIWISDGHSEGAELLERPPSLGDWLIWTTVDGQDDWHRVVRVEAPVESGRPWRVWVEHVARRP